MPIGMMLMNCNPVDGMPSSARAGHGPLAVLSGLIDARLHPVPQNIAFEFRKHGQHARESAATRSGEIKRFAQRNKAHVERRQFLKRVNKSTSDRPQRSSRQTKTRSISRRRANSMSISRFGRVVAPDPTSFTSIATAHFLLLA
jgi:hypothetical protein